jgi:hypothetical protein
MNFNRVNTVLFPEQVKNSCAIEIEVCYVLRDGFGCGFLSDSSRFNTNFLRFLSDRSNHLSDIHSDI